MRLMCHHMVLDDKSIPKAAFLTTKGKQELLRVNLA